MDSVQRVSQRFREYVANSGSCRQLLSGTHLTLILKYNRQHATGFLSREPLLDAVPPQLDLAQIRSTMKDMNMKGAYHHCYDAYQTELLRSLLPANGFVCSVRPDLSQD